MLKNRLPQLAWFAGQRRTMHMELDPPHKALKKVHFLSSNPPPPGENAHCTVFKKTVTLVNFQL